MNVSQSPPGQSLARRVHEGDFFRDPDASRDQNLGRFSRKSNVGKPSRIIRYRRQSRFLNDLTHGKELNPHWRTTNSRRSTIALTVELPADAAAFGEQQARAKSTAGQARRNGQALGFTWQSPSRRHGMRLPQGRSMTGPSGRLLGVDQIHEVVGIQRGGRGHCSSRPIPVASVAGASRDDILGKCLDEI